MHLRNNIVACAVTCAVMFGCTTGGTDAARAEALLETTASANPNGELQGINRAEFEEGSEGSQVVAPQPDEPSYTFRVLPSDATTGEDGAGRAVQSNEVILLEVTTTDLWAGRAMDPVLYVSTPGNAPLEFHEYTFVSMDTLAYRASSANLVPENASVWLGYGDANARIDLRGSGQ